MMRALRGHWPEYLIEALALGLFMVSAGTFGTLLFAPGMPLHAAIEAPMLRRVAMGLCMGLTAMAIVYSPLGQRSGAHMNPAMTLTFLRLGKIAPWDAAFYVLAQFAGGIAGVVLVRALLGAPFVDPPVRWVATVPGVHGPAVAFAAELSISFLLMTTVLWVSNHDRFRRLTGVFAGSLVALFISFEDPFSGMSMNPARTLASAVPGAVWHSTWLYFLAPPLGMLAAAELYRSLRGLAAVRCAKLDHPHTMRCIFRCGYCAHSSPQAD